MKKKSGIKYLRYRNLTQELAKYGYEYTPKKALFAYGMIVLVAAIFGLLYKLELPYIAAIGIVGVVFSPMVILQTMKGRYHTTMFSLANNYMEQFLYSFKRNGTVLNTVSVSAGTGIESVSGGGSYYYGATSIVDAAVKTGYTWKNWSGTYTNISKRYSFTVVGNVALTANAEANTYYIVFYTNGGSGTMTTMTCKYDQTYTLPAMSFIPPAHPCTYLGWNTDANAYSASYSERQQIRNLTSEDEYTFHFYAIWDYAPDLTCSDRYFTLYEAKTGIITEDELLRTVKSTDREDGTTQIRVKNYSSTMFTRFTRSGELVIIYTTTDSRNNTTEKQVRVMIVDTDVTVEGPMDFDGKKQYARFIDSGYYLKSYEDGGLESTSKWKSEVTYKDTLEAAMYNVKGEDGNWSHTVQTWEFSKEDIDQVKQYVKDNGMGNSENCAALKTLIIIFVVMKF